jgi:hypothetical protein
VKTYRQSGSAAVAAATEPDAPEGARKLQLHHTREFSPRQVPLAEGRLSAWGQAWRRPHTHHVSRITHHLQGALIW